MEGEEVTEVEVVQQVSLPVDQEMEELPVSPQCYILTTLEFFHLKYFSIALKREK